MGNCFNKKKSVHDPKSSEILRHVQEKPDEIFVSESESKHTHIKTTLLVFDNGNAQLKKFFRWKNNDISKVLDQEIQVYQDMSALFKDSSPVPKLQSKQIESSRSILFFSCYRFNLIDLLVSDQGDILKKLQSRIVEIIIPLIRDLGDLSERNIHHLQINPSNIFVSSEGRIKLRDFIIPQSYDVYFQHSGNIYENKFKIEERFENWQAPELAIGTQSYNREKVDVYAVGRFIELFNSQEERLKHLVDAMLKPNPAQRAGFAQCLDYLKDKGAFPLYTLMKNDLNDPHEFYETNHYACYKFRRESYGQLFEICQYRLKENGNREILKDFLQKLEKACKRATLKSSLVRLYHSVIENDVFTTVTEFYENNFEKKILMHKKNEILYTTEDIWDICTPLLEVFRILAERKLLHGDIRPRNLLITPENNIKVTGFLPEGINLVGDIQRINQLHETGALLAPEYLDQNLIIAEEFDYFKADVYSLGLTLFEIVSNQSSLEFNHKQLIRCIKKLDNLNDEMKNLLRNMLLRSNTERYDITACNKFNAKRPSHK